MGSVILAGYEFEGPYLSTESIADVPGLYAILCLHKRRPPQVLDIGSAGEGMHHDSQGLRRRLKSHNRRRDWESFCKEGTLVYAVRHESNQERRLQLEDELRWRLDPRCGANPWDVNTNVQQSWTPASMEELYGPRGMGSVLVEG